MAESETQITKRKATKQLLKYFLIIVAVIFAGAFAIHLFEHGKEANIHTFFDAIWWALVTITTVGYGDLYPVSFWGRIIGIIFIMLGFIAFSIFTAFIASTFIDIKFKERKGLGTIKQKNHIVICGWNSSTNKILDFLSNVDNKKTVVLLNELDADEIANIQSKFPNLDIKFIKGDFTNQDILNRTNIKQASHVILMYDESKPNSVPSDERTIIAVHNIIYMKLKGKISVQLKDEKYLPNIRQEKIHNVVIYDNIGGNLLANSTLYPAVPDFVQELIKYKNGIGFREMEIPKDFIGKTFGELLNYFLTENIILIGIVSEQLEFTIDKILSDDSSSIDQFIKEQFEKSRKKLPTDKTKSYIKIKPDNDYVIQENDKAIVI